tara:strand:- start:299 stop:559 length:261 start_codon:yes stop_codon:yes gene_type:complete
MILKFINILFTSLIILFIRLYQLALSPLIKSNCRYLPSCSEYSIIALKEHGLIIGLYYTLKRIFSCHPYGGRGYDPVPKKMIKDSK